MTTITALMDPNGVNTVRDKVVTDSGEDETVMDSGEVTSDAGEHTAKSSDRSLEAGEPGSDDKEETDDKEESDQNCLHVQHADSDIGQNVDQKDNDNHVKFASCLVDEMAFLEAETGSHDKSANLAFMELNQSFHDAIDDSFHAREGTFMDAAQTESDYPEEDLHYWDPSDEFSSEARLGKAFHLSIDYDWSRVWSSCRPTNDH